MVAVRKHPLHCETFKLFIGALVLSINSICNVLADVLLVLVVIPRDYLSKGFLLSCWRMDELIEGSLNFFSKSFPFALILFLYPFLRVHHHTQLIIGRLESITGHHSIHLECQTVVCVVWVSLGVWISAREWTRAEWTEGPFWLLSIN